MLKAKNVLIFLSLSSLSMTSCTTVTPQMVLDKSYGGNGKDGLRTLVALTDGGFVLGGWRDQQKPGHVGIGYIVNIDSDGTVRWDKDVVTNGENRVSNIIERKDKTLVLVVEEYPTPEDPGQVVMMELSSGGDIIDQHEFGGSGANLVEIMRPTPDGGYMFAGESASSPKGDYQGWLGKLSANFELEWEHRIGEANSPDVFQDITLLPDGSFIGVGMLTEHSTDPQKPARPWAAKISDEGELVWSKLMTTGNLFTLRGAAVTDQGQIALAGYTRNWDLKDYNAWIGAMSPDGEILWGKELPKDGFDQMTALEPTQDGRFVAIGATKTAAGDFDLMLIKFTASGDEVITHTHTKAGSQFGRAVQPLKGNGVAVGGFNTLDTPEGQQLWFLKTQIQ